MHAHTTHPYIHMPAWTPTHTRIPAGTHLLLNNLLTVAAQKDGGHFTGVAKQLTADSNQSPACQRPIMRFHRSYLGNLHAKRCWGNNRALPSSSSCHRYYCCFIIAIITVNANCKLKFCKIVCKVLQFAFRSHGVKSSANSWNHVYSSASTSWTISKYDVCKRAKERDKQRERDTQRQRQKHREREQKSHKTCSDKSETVTDNKIKHNFNMVSYTAIIKQYKT